MSLNFDPERGFGIYIHWPYCTRICPYCDFNVYAAKKRDPGPLVDAISQDLEYHRGLTGRRQVDSIFFGGGTPSLIPPDQIDRLISLVADLWDLAPNVEVTLEANPDDDARFADIAATGVNRLSLGVQSLDDKELKFLGRLHDAEQARNAISVARSFFPSLSLDFIYALPDQSTEQWNDALKHICSLEADHLSLYELTIESGAAFAKAVERGNWVPANEDRAADLYELTTEVTEKSGYPAYEISNHSTSPNHQARHNIIYWRSGDWVGVGPGAHGRLTVNGERRALHTYRRPWEYLANLTERGDAIAEAETMSFENLAAERLIMGLRLVEGVETADIEALIAGELNAPILDSLSQQGLVRIAENRLQLTKDGRLLADHVAHRLINWL